MEKQSQKNGCRKYRRSTVELGTNPKNKNQCFRTLLKLVVRFASCTKVRVVSKRRNLLKYLTFLYFGFHHGREPKVSQVYSLSLTASSLLAYGSDGISLFTGVSIET